MARGASFFLALALACASFMMPAAHAGGLDYKAAIVVNPDTVHTLYSYDADLELPPASLAKMLVALLASERLRPQDHITISRAAATAEADEVRWPLGSVFTVDDVVHGALLESSNGAAIALAEKVAGSVRAAIPMLAERAAQVGATHTRILDPSGLDTPGQHSTARDLAWMAASILADPWLSNVVRSRSYDLAWPGAGRHTFHNLNRFLFRYRGAVGVKNGYTSKAGNCVAAAATRNGRTLVAVVLGGSYVFDDAAKLLDRAFKTREPSGPPEFALGRASQPHRIVAASAGDPRPVASRTLPIALAGLLAAYSSRVLAVRRRVERRRRRRVNAR